MRVVRGFLVPDSVPKRDEDAYVATYEEFIREGRKLKAVLKKEIDAMTPAQRKELERELRGKKGKKKKGGWSDDGMCHPDIPEGLF